MISLLTNIDPNKACSASKLEGSFFSLFLGKIISNEHSHDCAILIPDLTRHEDVVEVIAGIFLRESCSLGDGDTVSIVLE